MKTYRGMHAGEVIVDGQPLKLRRDLLPAGAENDPPRLLALTILADHYGDDAQAVEDQDTFLHTVIGSLAGADPWTLTTLEILRALDELDLGR